MTLPVLILRPLEAARSTEKKAKQLGLTPVVDPLFEIRPVPWIPPSIDQYSALLFTSANAVKQSGVALKNYRALPVLAVGAVTSSAAKSAGFEVEYEGLSGVQSLFDTLPKDRFLNILHLTGKHMTSVKTDRDIDTKIVYESADIGLGRQARECLDSGSVVMLHSARAGSLLVNQMNKYAFDPGKSHVAAISAKVAKAAESAWKSTSVAERPTDEALLALAARLYSV